MEKTNIQKFLEEYGELVKKYSVDFISLPVFVPSEQGEFKIIIQTSPVDLQELKKQQDAQNFFPKK